jgi:hypothetical protein
MTANSLIVCSATTVRFVDYAGTVSWTIPVPPGSLYSCKLNKADGVGLSHNRNMRWYTFGSSFASANHTGGFYQFFYEVDFTPDNTSSTRLIGPTYDGRLFKLALPQASATVIFTNVQFNFVVCYSKDGNYFAAGDNAGKFFIFDSSENVVQSLQESPTGITRCRFSYDSKYLAFNDNTRGNIIIYTTNCLNTPTC